MSDLSDRVRQALAFDERKAKVRATLIASTSDSQRRDFLTGIVQGGQILAEWERKRTQALDAALTDAVEALAKVDAHLQFFAHVEKRYKEVGKETVAFDKCAEIRAAHADTREALTRIESALEGK